MNERMKELDEHIEQGREWPALRIIYEELIRINKKLKEGLNVPE